MQRLVLAGRVLDEHDLEVEPLGGRRRARLGRQPAVADDERQVPGPLRERDSR